MLNLRNSFNAFSEPRPSRTLEVEEASKSGLPILLLTIVQYLKQLKFDVILRWCFESDWLRVSYVFPVVA